MDETKEKSGFLGGLFGNKAKKEIPNTNQGSNEELLSREESAKRTQENIARGGAKDFTSEIQGQSHSTEPSRQVSEPVGTEKLAGESLQKKQIKTAYEQSAAQGQQIKEQQMNERMKEALKKPETPGEKLNRIVEGKTREE
jgi:hypothetical protein